MRKELIEKRKSFGYTQEEVAERAGLTKQYISFVENGRQHPSLRGAIKIASVLQVDIDPSKKIAEAFSNLGRIPVKDIYHVASVFGIEFDSKGLFKEVNQ